MAAQGGAKAGMPARENFHMGRQIPGYAGGNVEDMGCVFPAPPPQRTYCGPAAFTGTDGRDHHLIVTAYGYSRPNPRMF